MIDLKDIKLSGKVIDIGCENYGIVYNICKNSDSDIKVEYIEEEKGQQIFLEEYNTAVLFFTLGRIKLKANKKKLINQSYNYLMHKGEILIWDIDKPNMQIADSNLKFRLPDNKLKKINIKDYGLFRNNSKDSLLKIIHPFFDIVELKCYDNIYYIKGIKKGCAKDEAAVNSD
jgi:hypothetical protein